MVLYYIINIMSKKFKVRSWGRLCAWIWLKRGLCQALWGTSVTPWVPSAIPSAVPPSAVPPVLVSWPRRGGRIVNRGLVLGSAVAGAHRGVGGRLPFNDHTSRAQPGAGILTRFWERHCIQLGICIHYCAPFLILGKTHLLPLLARPVKKTSISMHFPNG